MFGPLVLLFAAALALNAAGPLLSEPALSPNHAEIAFVSGGDIWTVPAEGGEARLLISDPATESRPLYSPDGTRLAFQSTRTGIADIYVLELATGALKRLTFDDARLLLDAWSPDSQFLYFSSNAHDTAQMDDLYRIPAAGGTPAVVSADRFTDESQAAPNPVNGSVAFLSGIMAVGQWWRKGHAHIDETQLILLTPDHKYHPLLENHAKNLWPLWSADGKHLYFVSDRSGSENIWQLTPGGSAGQAAARQVTRFTDGRVLWPGIAKDGKALVFERDFAIWKLDPANGKSAPVPITLRGTPAGPGINHLALTSQFRNMRLSPDGKKVAFSARGQLFAASAKDGGSAARLTQTAALESSPVWAPDNRRIAYVSDRDGTRQLYLYDLGKETETRLTNSNNQDEDPIWSPNGKELAYVRDGRELHALNLESKADRLLVTEKFRVFRSFGEHPISWSPDSQWLSFFSEDAGGFRNVFAIPAAGGTAQPVSFLANSFADDIVWSPDRTYLLFSTGQRTERREIARVELLPRPPKFREDQFRDLFREEEPRPVTDTKPASAPAAPKPEVPASPAALVAPAAKPPAPVRIVFDDIRRRLSLLPLDLDTGSPRISPDGKTLLILASSGGGQQNFYTYSLDELAKEPAVPRQLTSTAGFKSDPHFSPDGKEVFFLEGGRIQIVTVETRAVRPLAVTAELDVDFDQEKREVFRQAWALVNETYYDPKFHGANWSGLRGQFAPRIEAARTPDEMRRVLSLMIGELNSSHSGIAAPFGGAPPSAGRLGLEFDPASGVITDVTPLGPADLAGIKTGEKLLSLDGKPITASTSLPELLQHKAGKRTVVATSVHPSVPLLPISGQQEKQLLYRKWVDANRQYVAKASNGRLGYVHIPDMSAASLNQLYIDLDTENHSRQGLVIDLRNNNGGFVNAYALDVFARKPYFTMTTRDHSSSPARSQLGQRSLELPTVLVVNQNSLSDAEDFTEGYRALKLGKIVGVPTAGWIIYTSGRQLIDGSLMREPNTKVSANDSTDMELHPRPVDIEVDRPVGESFTGRDTQLDQAVKTLLSGLPAASDR